MLRIENAGRIPRRARCVPARFSYVITHMDCPSCRQYAADHLLNCPSCGVHIGFPNVRKATEDRNQRQLRFRYAEARTSLLTRGTWQIAQQFERLVAQSSRAIPARWAILVQNAVEQDGGVFLTYYQQVNAGRRQPQNNAHDIQRQAIDATFFPYYFEQITFLALSLGNRGIEYYGDFHFAYNPQKISSRTSVFEKNSLSFARENKMVAGDSGCTAGFMSAWEQRGVLSLCKLNAKITPQMQQSDFPGLLLDSTSAEGADFVECHVHGSVGFQGLDEVTCRPATTDEKRVTQLRVIRLLRQQGIETKEVP